MTIPVFIKIANEAKILHLLDELHNSFSDIELILKDLHVLRTEEHKLFFDLKNLLQQSSTHIKRVNEDILI